MKKNYASILSLLFISCILGLVYFTIMPQWVSDEEVSLSEFSTKRALNQVGILAAKPHYVSSENHTVVADYIENELKNLGLETQIQEGTTFTDWGNLVKSKNIIARIKGTNNSKALLLLSHYDSAPHSSSLGASDNASGVATILEGLRTFLYNKTAHKNDIIVLFSDGEELGLNGAALFVTQNKWAKDIGLALNFEARGTGGPSYMLMEVNEGNAAMVNGFANASPKFPVSNSLMYSIYKMLPNDTDLTVFREAGAIQGFNFAFIDDHFNYHTAQDNLNHLSRGSIAHQGSYLMPMLDYFSNANLKKMDDTEDYVYFSTPFCFVSYPFSWILPMWIATLLLFLFIVFVGIGKRVLAISDIAKGFLPLLYSLLTSGIIGFVGWKLLILCYPQYKDILQGFTYNGHDYIGAFIFISLAISFLFYRKTTSENLVINQSIAPLFIWICLNFAIVFYLPGAAFFIIPTFFSLLMLAYFVITQKTHPILNLFLSIPTLIIIVPFIIMFPIGLGLKILFGTAVLTSLVFGLILPVLGSFSNKIIWSVLMLFTAIGFFINANINSGYQGGTAKPNSLLYVLDADKKQATWSTYDVNLDYWTKKYLGNTPKTASAIKPNVLYSKYNSQFTYTATAPVKNLAKANIEFIKDSIVGSQRYIKIKISSNRKVNRYDIFAKENIVFHNLKANGALALGQKGSKFERRGPKILSYYVVDNEPLVLQFSVPIKTVLEMDLMESSFDLMTNPLFKMQKRASWMMPMPFVLTDAIVIKQKIKR